LTNKKNKKTPEMGVCIFGRYTLRRRKNRSEEELIDMMQDVQYNRAQKMAQFLMDWQGLEMASKAHEIKPETMEAQQKSASQLRKLQREADRFRWLKSG
jgi:hypothetical protein